MRYCLITLILVTALVACKQSSARKGANGVIYKNATEYNDYIITRQVKLMHTIAAFTRVLQVNADSAIGLIRDASKDAGRVITEVRGMPSYGGDSSFRAAAVESFTFYKRLFERDYPAMLDIYLRPGIDTEEANAEVNKMGERLDKDEEMLNKAFHNAQQQFARKNNLKLIDNPEQKELQNEFEKFNTKE